ncbi:MULTISPECIES: glyceraldehyde-3-phosphate dehydrogenase [Salimicrobium]|uniref:Glyceraldehyde-3-phosphate dehydrogenase n=4 Tax=Salimicrobium TaxID=351195 RepID=K2GAL9_9BACI|nr:MULTISPECIES: glyceraldehyde-3-phosphate dehydrogenase [Salimicrobium]AKG04155.1 type I glyceraldehyde-3-phosphate dehydrogenase [Salimicrobium jeotgali]EKE32113.1 glyceraldehyde-3-phosphate dehydrogenase [Salimicrobium jeotgali]MBM7695723.1 glyceraldehyde 3-phosphate dehydrogenase [Salimicrobium jeotgali]PBB06724.1 glyceraldehyde-3-phosphate dehydrogenase [Salimicrobium humidisoli]SDX59901.1 glyceraldehyde-3-phosphate dehydrogenase (NAD+) [Salimicrobium album]
MGKAKVAINGLGRIGRMVLRQLIDDDTVELAAVNASYPPETLAHMIKYDSVHGKLNADIDHTEEALYINNHKIALCQERDPAQLPWGQMGIDVVIEATGKFRERDAAAKHLSAGAEKVIITAPGKQADATIVMGVNNEAYDHHNHHVISNASCTTNCLAPVVKILEDEFGIVDGLMTTVHSFTNDQQNLDNPHKDLRRARGCTQSIIPTSTGAARAISEVVPELEGKLNGMALRVPTPNVSLIDLVVDLKEDVTKEDVNETFKRASEDGMKNILSYSDEPLVSIDYTSSPYSSIIDGLTTQVVGDRKVKVLAWYDNEWGYSARTVDLTKMVAEQLMSEKKQKVS